MPSLLGVEQSFAVTITAVFPEPFQYDRLVGFVRREPFKREAKRVVTLCIAERTVEVIEERLQLRARDGAWE